MIGSGLLHVWTIAGNELANLAFGFGPDAAGTLAVTSAKLRDEPPIADRFAAEGAFRHAVRLQEGVDLSEDGVMLHETVYKRDMPRTSMPFAGQAPILRAKPRAGDKRGVSTLDLEALKAALRAETGADGKWSARGLSMAAGGKPDLVRDILRGENKNPSADVVVRLAREMKRDLKEFVKGQAPSSASTARFMMKVTGAVAAGVWLEQTNWTDEEQYEVEVAPLEGREASLDRVLLELRGHSMDKTIPPGSVLDCVRTKYSDIAPEDGDLVIVERHAHDLTEMTVKRLRRGKDGWELHAESTKPEFQEVIKWEPPSPDLYVDNEIQIVAIVLEARQLHRRRRLL